MSNNILYGDTSYFTSYIQSFLRSNFSTNVLATNIYDIQTHQALIKYLNQANVEDMSIVERKIKEQYDEFNTMFTLVRQEDSLVFNSKRTDEQTSEFISFYIEEIKQFVKDLGWYVEEYNDFIDFTYDINDDGILDSRDKVLVQNYLSTKTGLTKEQINKADYNLDGSVTIEDYNQLANYIDSNKLFIKITAEDRKNFFPNKDMLNFINLFSNDFIFYKQIVDGLVKDDESGEHKICIIECKPGTEYTIAHGSNQSQRLIIGSMISTRRTMETNKLQNVIDITLAPGEPYLYKTSQQSEDGIQMDAKYLLIQCASNIEGFSKTKEESVYIRLGDVNFDGKINNIDRKIVADYIFYPEGDDRRPVLTDRQFAAADINLNGQIDSDDLQRLADYIDGKTTSLGVIEYKYKVPVDMNELNNVASLLVMEGNQIERNTGETKSANVYSLHEEERTSIYNVEDDLTTQSQMNNYEVTLNNSAESNYDKIKYQSQFVRIEGDCYREKDVNLGSPKPVNVVDDLVITVNQEDPIYEDMSGYKLVKINNSIDYIYQQNNKYYIHKEIIQLFSNNIDWKRQETNVSGKYYLVSSEPTDLMTINDDTVIPNLISNALETTSQSNLLNITSGFKDCISVDNVGRIMIYIDDISSIEEKDMLYWIQTNPFYLYGEQQLYQDIELSSEIKAIDLVEGTNNISITSQTLLPSKITIKSEILGIDNSYLDCTKRTFQKTESTICVNFNSFTNDPWIVNHKFIAYLLDQAVTPYSRSEDITYTQNLIRELYPVYDDSFIPGVYSDLLKELVEKYQREHITYGVGDMNKDNKINEVDINLVKDYLTGKITFTREQQLLADVNNDKIVDINDLNMLIKENSGIDDKLKIFDIQFAMGYLDPLTEYTIQKELSNRLNKSSKEVGWYKFSK